MKRVVMLVTLAALMAVVSALSAAPAFAADPWDSIPVARGESQVRYQSEVKETPAGTLDYAYGHAHGISIGKGNENSSSVNDGKGVKFGGSSQGPAGAYGAAGARAKFTLKQPTGGEATTEL